jgi:L-ascorbate metabolism protein UlaG (beta-lactamase superfamily)
MCLLLRFHGLWVVLALSAAVAMADDQGATIAAALKAAPPALPMTVARKKALGEFDAWLAPPHSERLDSRIAYYRATVHRALDALEQGRPTVGVRIVQLYSSSVLVQTPDTVFAFDLDQGPNGRLETTPFEEGVGFSMTDAQVARIASLVRYSFHTHEHDDHVDYQLTKALLAAGKTVIVTESNKRLWQKQPWAEKLSVLPQTDKEPIRLGPLAVDVLCDFQWNDAKHTRGTPCDAFVVNTAGVTVMTKGDINCGTKLYDWIAALKQRGQRVDAVVGSTLFWRGVNKLPDWEKLFSPLWLPGHAWEFTHRSKDGSKGNCAAYLQAWLFTGVTTCSEKVQVLTWGEAIDVMPPAQKNVP